MANPKGLDPWYYPVSIGGEPVEMGVGNKANHEYLRQYVEYRGAVLTSPVMSRYKFRGKTMLDVACNCGYWGLRYARKGLKKYVGIEGRQVFVEQGIMLWKEADLDIDFSFYVGDVMEHELWARACGGSVEPFMFDFVLCSGILYHLPEWLPVLQHCIGLAGEALVIDTRIYPEERVREDKKDLSFNRLNKYSDNVKLPTFKAIVEALEAAGFAWEVLENPLEPFPEIVSSDVYGSTEEGRVAIYAWRKDAGSK